MKRLSLSYWLNLARVALLVSCAFAVLGFAYHKWQNWQYWDRTNLGHKPPAQIFSRLFHVPMPRGVSNLQIAGFSSLGGEVWMKFQAADVDAITRTLTPQSPQNSNKPNTHLNYLPDKKYILQNQYANAVDWSNVYALKAPECYELDFTESERLQRSGLLVVDRKRKIIYITVDLTGTTPL